MYPLTGGFMAKSKEQSKARELRKNGLSMKEIARTLKVSKSSISLWCSDIQLTKKQIEKLHAQMVRGSYKGRMIGVQMQKDGKKRRIEKYKLLAEKDISKLVKRELFLAGVGLYWGEGAKSSAVKFYNSDFRAVQFMMRWFREVLKIEEERFLMYISINEIHKKRLKSVIEYWSRITKIDAIQFRKPSLIKTKNKKVYENFSEHYGTLCIRISKSTNLLYRILGWIGAMSKPE
jgi:transcriptional regulator with XRE-family HTH domain